MHMMKGHRSTCLARHLVGGDGQVLCKRAGSGDLAGEPEENVSGVQSAA